MKYARKYSTQITSKTTLFGLNFSYAHSTPGLFEPGMDLWAILSKIWFLGGKKFGEKIKESWGEESWGRGS